MRVHWMAAVGLLLAACGGPGPCKQCPVVGGQYAETSSGAGTNCGGGRNLSYRGGDLGDFTLEQEGSRLAIKGIYDINGVLREDSSASFGPFPAIAIPTTRGGSDVPGKVVIEGRFTSTSPPVFDGKYVFTTFIDSCILEAPLKWRPAEE